MNIKDTFWLLPFLFFIAGYSTLSVLYKPKKVTTPPLIGKSIKDALSLASGNRLNLRLLEQREDSELPEGTIISQKPSAFAMAKPNQTIFCMISKQPIVIIPNLVGKYQDQALHELREKEIHGGCYTLESIYPKGYCFAQSPNAQTELETKKAILYISSGENRPILFPNLKNQPVSEVQEFLKPYGISTTIINKNPLIDHECDHLCVVYNQRPLPGTIVILDPEKPLQVQLQVNHQSS